MRKCELARLIGILCLMMSASLFGQIYFGITPIRAEHSGKPGESFTDIFQIRNNSPRPIRIKVYAENWTMQPDGVPAFIGTEPTSYSCRDWIKVNPQDFRLMPDEIKTVRYTVTVPSGIPAAGYHASISFETVPDTIAPRTASGMVFTGKIAAAVYVKVGQVPIEGDVVDIKLARKDNSQALVLVMKNTGKTHFRTKGRIEVFDSGKKKIMDLEVPDEVVLPESEREVACPLSKALEPGTYRAVCRLDIGRPEILGLEKALEVEQ
jgi:P pilus assembly chaperone PapD